MKKYDVDFIQRSYEEFVGSPLESLIPFLTYLDYRCKKLTIEEIESIVSFIRSTNDNSIKTSTKVKKEKKGFSVMFKNKLFTVYFEDYNDTIVKCCIDFDIPEFDIWGLKSIGVAKIFDPEKYPDHQYNEDEINDKFDIVIGRRIAFDKALEKMIKIHHREMKKFILRNDKDVKFIDMSLEKRVDKFFRTGR